MKKILTTVLLAIVAAAVVLYFTSNIVMAAILSNVIGAPVKVGRVSLGTSGAGIYGLVIGNPKGFHEKKLALVPEVSVAYDLGAFFKGKVHLKRIHINMEEVTIERNSDGKFNLMEIKAMKKPAQDPNKQKAPEPEPSKEPTEPSKPAKPAKPMPLQIDEVVLDLGKARFANDGTVKEFAMNVKGQTFHDVTYAPTLIREIVFFILKKVGMSAFPANLDTLLKGVGGEMGTQVSKWMDKLNKF